MLLDDMISLRQKLGVVFSEQLALTRHCMYVAAQMTGKCRMVCFLSCLVLAEFKYVERHTQQHWIQGTWSQLKRRQDLIGS